MAAPPCRRQHMTPASPMTSRQQRADTADDDDDDELPIFLCDEWPQHPSMTRRLTKGASTRTMKEEKNATKLNTSSKVLQCSKKRNHCQVEWKRTKVKAQPLQLILICITNFLLSKLFRSQIDKLGKKFEKKILRKKPLESFVNRGNYSATIKWTICDGEILIELSHYSLNNKLSDKGMDCLSRALSHGTSHGMNLSVCPVCDFRFLCVSLVLFGHPTMRDEQIW